MSVAALVFTRSFTNTSRISPAYDKLLLAVIAAVGRVALPSRSALSLIAVSGALDMLANILFLFATRTGLLTISALLTSLYPIVVVMLARQLLAERLGRPQTVAVAFALIAVALITIA